MALSEELLPTGAVMGTLTLPSLDAYITAVHGEPRALIPDEVAILAAWGAGIVAFIRARWPVDTGTSRDNWTFEVNPSPGEMAIIVENEMYYAEFVYRKGDSSKTPLWSKLIREAWERAKEPLLVDAKAAIDANERRFERELAQTGNEEEALRELFAFRRKRPASHRIAPPPRPDELRP